MLSFVNLVNDEMKIQENLEKIRQKKCDSHNKYQASHFCTNPSCIKNSTSFLCEFCYNNHSKNHLNRKEIKTIDELFSTKRLTQMKEDCKLDSAFEEKVIQVLQDLDRKFGKLKKTVSKIIDDECKKAKNHVKEKFSAAKNNERIMKVINEHEKVLLDLFTKDEIMKGFELAINPYLESIGKISEAFRTQIEIVENRDKNIESFSQNFKKINEKSKDLVDFIQQKFFNFDDIPQIQNSIVSLNDQEFWLSLTEKSSIIGDGLNGETQILMNWIERKGEESCKLKLIYRGSRDGFTAQAFHLKCDDKSPTISFIKSDQNKIFGGYTQQTWASNNKYKTDDKAFLFSFSSNEKYPIKTPEKAIYGNNSYSITYGGSCFAGNEDIRIFDNCNTNSSSSSDFPNSYSCSKYPSKTEESKAYLAGAKKFKVIEIEVFEVIWI